MENLKIREFENAISQFVSSSSLPPETKRLALAEVMRQVEAEAAQAIKAEILERDAMETREEGKENGNAESIPED